MIRYIFPRLPVGKNDLHRIGILVDAHVLHPDGNRRQVCFFALGGGLPVIVFAPALATAIKNERYGSSPPLIAPAHWFLP
ncbi:hypothetical protein LJB89_02340, partial [Tyzzerella sp. OttesenSCG-928-J15]|nr:hypothetical protein [Tyzzerella sp. OttesenSCG-928-J15]